LELPTKEKEAIRESFILRANAWAVISEQDFLQELRGQQAYFTSKGGYVGLARFIKFHLGAKGFDFAASYGVAESLKAKGLVSIYDGPGTTDGHPVKAIRAIDKPSI